MLWLRRAEGAGSLHRRQLPALPCRSCPCISQRGLSSPVVFLCDTARRFNRQDSRESVLVRGLGLGAKLIDLKRPLEYPTLARNAIRLP